MDNSLNTSDIFNAKLIKQNVHSEEDFKFQCLQILQNHQFKKLTATFSDSSERYCVLTGYDCKMKKSVIIQSKQLAKQENQDIIKLQILAIQEIKPHKCVANFQRYVLAEDKNILFTVWEHNSDCQDLLSLVKSPYLNVDEIQRVSRNIYAGISFLHSQGLTLGAIRPETILRDSDGWVKVACFGDFNRKELLEGDESLEKDRIENECPLEIIKKVDLDSAFKVMKYLWNECEKVLKDSSEIYKYQQSRMKDIFTSISDMKTAKDIANKLGWNELIEIKKQNFLIVKTSECCIVDGKKTGKERCAYWKNQIIYKDWKDGKILHAVLYYEKGDIYTGQIVNNQPEGYGELMWKKTGGKYTGMFKQNKMEGEGICDIEGAIVKGKYKNNQVEGFGITLPGNGDFYVGNFKHHKKNGLGTYYWKSQGYEHDVYEGIWKNDQMYGKGVIKYKDGNVYEGDMKNGKMEGYGVLYFANGNIYQGEWKNSQYYGYGELYYSESKSSYKGEFKDSLRYGKGIQTDANGVVTAYWKNGVVLNVPEPTLFGSILNKVKAKSASCHIF